MPLYSFKTILERGIGQFAFIYRTILHIPFLGWSNAQLRMTFLIESKINPIVGARDTSFTVFFSFFPSHELRVKLNYFYSELFIHAQSKLTGQSNETDTAIISDK